MLRSTLVACVIGAVIVSAIAPANAGFSAVFGLNDPANGRDLILAQANRNYQIQQNQMMQNQARQREMEMQRQRQMEVQRQQQIQQQRMRENQQAMRARMEQQRAQTLRLQQERMQTMQAQRQKMIEQQAAQKQAQADRRDAQQDRESVKRAKDERDDELKRKQTQEDHWNLLMLVASQQTQQRLLDLSSRLEVAGPRPEPGAGTDTAASMTPQGSPWSPPPEVAAISGVSASFKEKLRKLPNVNSSATPPGTTSTPEP